MQNEEQKAEQPTEAGMAQNAHASYAGPELAIVSPERLLNTNKKADYLFVC